MEHSSAPCTSVRQAGAGAGGVEAGEARSPWALPLHSAHPSTCKALMPYRAVLDSAQQLDGSAVRSPTEPF